MGRVGPSYTQTPGQEAHPQAPGRGRPAAATARRAASTTTPTIPPTSATRRCATGSRKYHPTYLLHGHVHPRPGSLLTRIGDTQVVYVNGAQGLTHIGRETSPDRWLDVDHGRVAILGDVQCPPQVRAAALAAPRSRADRLHALPRRCPALWATPLQGLRRLLRDGSESFASTAMRSPRTSSRSAPTLWVMERPTARSPQAARRRKPLFVGVARTSDVDAYLRDSARSEASTSSSRRSASSTRAAPARAPPARPRRRTSGRQGTALTWDVRSGDWSVVVMNEDGSRGVVAGVSAGARSRTCRSASRARPGVAFIVATAMLTLDGTRPPARSSSA